MTYTLCVNLEQLNILLGGLGHVPYMHAQPLLAEIQRQLAEQMPMSNPEGGAADKSAGAAAKME